MNEEERKQLEESIQKQAALLETILRESKRLCKRLGNEKDDLTYWKVVDLMLEIYKIFFEGGFEQERLEILRKYPSVQFVKG